MAKPQVNIKWDHGTLNAMNRRAFEGLLAMGFDIAALARQNAPYVTGALRNSIRVEDSIRSDLVYVRAGGIVSSGRRNGVMISRTVDYAWKVEQHSSRPHYMENAQRAIMTGNYLQKYFGGITK